MRLIDADKLKKELRDFLANDNHVNNPSIKYLDVLDVVEEQPTAYDIDYEKQIRAEVIEELFNKYVDTVDMDSNYLYAKVNRDNLNIPYISLKSILKEWIIEQLKEQK